MNKNLLLRATKIGVGSTLAVFLGSILGLQYATTAGVVTLLTIRNTKKGTLEVSMNRLLSFVVSMLFIMAISYFISDIILGFGLYMMCLVLFSYFFKWEDSVSVNAVIGTHIFWLEASVTASFILNEFCLVLIGTGMAVLVNNLYMLDNIEEIKADTKYIEGELREILISMANHLQNKQILSQDKTHIDQLIHHIDVAMDKSYENMGNTSNELSKYYLEYLNMRKSQCNVLFHFYRALIGIQTDCSEMKELAHILNEMAEAIHRTVGIRGMVVELEEFIAHMKTQQLPKTNEEFIAKAQIFYILEELEEILRLKSEFLSSISEESIQRYWGA